MIPLTIGDPTVFGNFQPPPGLDAEISRIVREGKSNGYCHSSGLEGPRAAIAASSKSPITANDVILTSGCSHALDIALSVLGDAQKNILLPRPCFSLYGTLCGGRGIATKDYSLRPEADWEVDLESLEGQVDEQTAAILINNPSNPCGSVFSESHLVKIHDVADKFNLPVISDEIYKDMHFPSSEKKFKSFAEISENVPTLVVGGLAKQFMIPGWRLGWVEIHDRNDRFKDEIRPGLADLMTLILGPNTITQEMVPFFLEKTQQSYYDEVMQQLEGNSLVIKKKLENCPGLKVIEPQGAMYVLIQITRPDIMNDVELTGALLQEESVFVLPGSSFGADNFFRIVTSPPAEKLEEACERIKAFCERKFK